MLIRTTLLSCSLSAATIGAAQNAYDARILSYEGLDFVCDGSIEPTLKIQNVGTTTMSTCVVETWKNGLPVNSFNWVLAVPALSGAVRQPALPPVTNVLPGDAIEFRIKSVNTIPDQGPEGNELLVPMDRVPKFAEGGAVSMEVSTGVLTGSVTWTIKSASGVVVAQGGPYEDPLTTVQSPLALGNSDCYLFEAVDGSRGSAPEIELRLVDAEGAVLTITGNDLLSPYTDGLRTGTGQPCDQEVTLEFNTDAQGEEVTWELADESSQAVICNGNGLASQAVIATTCCLQQGCYTLRVTDAGGDGMTTGGYILRTSGTHERIIDNRNNFSTGSVSAIAGGQGFCLPMSNDKLLFTSCDKLDWTNGQFVVATPNPAVSAEWVVGGSNAVQDNTSGYEFWIFDPNGTYSFRRFRSHRVSDGFGPASATRACHMKLNNWSTASHVPATTLMNVRIRSRINGVNGAFGPACRLMIDPVRAACPLTKLMDVPGSTAFSCGATRSWGSGNTVYARPVTGANRYQFRFRLPAEGFEVVRTVNSYILPLNWTTLPLQAGRTYDVDVRVSKDGGATWCSSSDPWGTVCQLTIGALDLNANSGMADGLNRVGSEPVTAIEAKPVTANEVKLFPNPNRGDRVYFTLSAVRKDVETVTVDIFDLTGKRVSAQVVPVAGGQFELLLDHQGGSVEGMYLVHITAGANTYTERLVVQH